MGTAFTSLRLLKMTQYFLGMQVLVLVRTIEKSLWALLIPMYLQLMLITFCGTFLFALE